jgi:hypothetical protein
MKAPRNNENVPYEVYLTAWNAFLCGREIGGDFHLDKTHCILPLSLNSNSQIICK